MTEFTIAYKDLCELLFNCGCAIEEGLHSKHAHLSEENVSQISEEIRSRFVPNFNRRKREVQHSKEKFLNRNSDWLRGTFVVRLKNDLPKENEDRSRGGRPQKHFVDCKKRAQLYKIGALRRSHSQELIDAAASTSKDHESSVFDADSALALITQARLSKYQYEVIRKAIKDKGFRIFPSYDNVLQAKTRCYPENIVVTEISAEVPLQNLLDHTVKRIIDTCEESQTEDWNNSLILHTKWGLDGASGQSEYKQRFSDESANLSDAHLFMTSIVPLVITLNSHDNLTVWKNNQPSSTRYCRALHFQFQKESPETIVCEKTRVEEEIRTLKETVVQKGDKTFSVSHKLHFTMIDGKVAQVITDTSSASNCIICGAKPSQMNDLSRANMPVPQEEFFKLGLSTLHARIKFMEYILHLSYNFDFEEWRTTPTTRPLKHATKMRVQEEFKKRLGLRVDFVNQGAGTSNDGNTSRRFFSNPEVTAEITKIDLDLIKRLATVLEILCCQSPIDPNKFREFTKETARLATTLYPWYYLPATVHKVLFHGADFVIHAALPIGALSEEAQESRNKDYKYYRSHHTRKMTRVATNEDIMHAMCVSSDPLISHLRPVFKKKHLPLSTAAKELLL